MFPLLRMAALTLLLSALLPAWTMSVEFPWPNLPRPIWERELAHLKEIGVAHVSLPQSEDAAKLDEVIRIVRRLGLEADLEGSIPERLQMLAKAHGGPITEPPPGTVRISAIMPRALDNERKLLTVGTTAILWTDVFEHLTPQYHPGAISLAGNEGPGAALLRREAQLARFWGAQLTSLPESPGARLSVPVDSVTVHQYIAEKSGATAPADAVPSGLSLVSVVNDSSDPWKGEVRAMYPAMQRAIALPSVAVAPYDVLWLPVNVPFAASSLCSGCTGFAPSDHLAYATAELTGMEYENGILALEFIAPSAGEAVLQLSHEPTGPLVAGGHPTMFDWDAKNLRARLPIPAGNTKTGRVRVALAIDAPPATGFFDRTPVLLIGETTRTTAQFSPAAVAARSRLRAAPEFTFTQEDPVISSDKDRPSFITYKITVPSTAIEGDTTQLAIEADGTQLSHTRIRIAAPATVTFEDAISVRVAAGSFVPLWPATIPVNQRSGRELVVTLHNNAPEIRTFELSLHAPGLDFSPAKMNISVGASVSRDVTFRVFGSIPATGLHEGEVWLSGAVTFKQPVQFLVLPAAGALAWSANGFSILESTKTRASFLGNRWLEMIDKDSGNDAQPAGGTDFQGGPIESLKLEDLRKPAPAR